MKQVLMVSYHFPPDAAVGAIRAAKFAKYLPEFGWQPYVLTVNPKYHDTLDQSRMSDAILPQNIFSTGVWPGPSPMYMRLKKWMYRLTGRRHIFEERLKTYGGADQVKAEAAVDMLRCFLRSLLMVADGMLGWVPPATFKALLLMRQHKINCLYTSGPPHAAHLVGLTIKLLSGTRWIADFRDPWALDLGKPAHMRSKLSEGAEAWMEKQVLNRADKIISVTERMSQAFTNRYMKLNKDKFATIPNGYDPEDFSTFQRPTNNGKFRVSYLGAFYMGRTPSYFLRAVRQLIDEGKLQPGELDVRFIGHCRYIDGQCVADMVQQEGLSSVVQIMDALPYRDALLEMAASDVLLLFAPHQPDQVPGKTFEYLASGADIIAFTSEGATADLIKSTGHGLIAEPDALEQIKRALEVCYHRYKMGSRCIGNNSLPSEVLLKYHRRTLTKELVSVLEE